MWTLLTAGGRLMVAQATSGSGGFVVDMQGMRFRTSSCGADFVVLGGPAQGHSGAGEREQVDVVVRRGTGPMRDGGAQGEGFAIKQRACPGQRVP